MLKNIQIKNKLQKNEYRARLLILIQVPLIIKSVQKLVSLNDFLFIEIQSILLSACLFLFILFSSKGLMYLLKLNVSNTFSYTLFFLASFSMANFLAIANIDISFFYFYLVILVLSNIAFLIFENNYLLKIFQSIILIIVGIVNFNRTYLNQFIFNRIEQSGDVELLIVPNIEKIYNSNVLQVFQNPVSDAGFFHINFTIFGNYYFATLAKTLSFFGEFLTTNILPYSLFYLSLLFIYELKIDTTLKLLILSLHLNILIINPWIRYLLNNSYMTEGSAALFFVIIFYNLFDDKTHSNLKLKTVYLFVGFFIFSKLFVSLFIFIFLIFIKKCSLQDFSTLLIGPLFISYFMFIKYPPDNPRELISGVNTTIIQNILKYWLEDSIWLYAILCSLVLTLIQFVLFKKIDLFSKYVLTFNALNLILIFILYTFSWTEGVDFQSSYRYMLQNYYLNLIYAVTVLRGKIRG